MRDPKSVPGGAGTDGRAVETDSSRSRDLELRFAATADAAVGRRLKQMYDGLINEPVPDRFLDLLRQLEQAEAPAAGVAMSSADGGKKSGGAP